MRPRRKTGNRYRPRGARAATGREEDRALSQGEAPAGDPATGPPRIVGHHAGVGKVSRACGPARSIAGKQPAPGMTAGDAAAIMGWKLHLRWEVQGGRGMPGIEIPAKGLRPRSRPPPTGHGRGEV